MHTLGSVSKFALAAVLSLLACTSYYTVERAGDDSSLRIVLAAISTPIAILGLVGTISLLGSQSKWRPFLWLSVPAFVAASVFLAQIWL